MFVAQQFTFSLCGLCGQESVDSFVLDAYTSLDGLQQEKESQLVCATRPQMRL